MKCNFKQKDEFSYLNEYDWKKIIENYFPKLDLKFCHWRNMEEELDELLDSLRSAFWLEKHQWSVRCDWILSSISNFATL